MSDIDSDSDSYPNEIKNQVVRKTTYFTGLKENKNIVDKDQTKNYIIFQNDFLHLQVKTLEDKINKMNHKIKDLENDNESMETSKNNLKFYVKNEHELSGYYKKINEIYEDEMSKMDKELFKVLKQITIVFVSYIVIGIILVYLNYFNEVFIIMNTGFVILNTNIMYPFFLKLIKFFDIKKDERVVKWRSEITKANQGNKYLDDLIDNF